MGMTRKDYCALAAAIKSQRSAATSTLEVQHRLDALAENIAAYISDSNPRFDQDRFLSACGYH